MQIHPSNWDLLLFRPHITQYRFTINGTVMSPDFIQGVPTIEKPMMLEPVIGRCCTGSITIDVRQGDIEKIPKAASVDVDCRLSSYDKTLASDWVPQGRYFVTKRSGYGDLVTLTCRDSMINAGKTYIDKAQNTSRVWPAPMADILADIARIMNVTIDPRTEIQTGSEYTISVPDNDMLMSEILAKIAAVHGGNFIITESGQLRLVPFPCTSTPVYDVKQEYKTYTPYSSGDNKISRIILKNASGQQFTVGDDTGVWLTGEYDTATQAMTSKLGGGAYSFANGTMYFPSGAFVAGTAVITDEALAFDSAGTAKTTVNGLLGRTYTPYRLDGAYIDPCIELGDTFTATYKGKSVQLIANSITINCTTGYTCRIENGIMYDDEEEVVYTTPKEIAQQRTAARAVRNTSRIAAEEERAQEEEGNIRTELTKLDDKIIARVTKEDVDSTLENYLLIDQFASELGSVLKTPDQTIRANIVTAINEQKGEGIVNINGDRVYVDANKSVSIGSVLDIYNGSLWGKVQAVFGEVGNFVTINNGAVKAPTIQVNGGGSLIFSGSSSPDSPVATVSIDRADAEKLKALTSFTGLTNAEIINGKTLKITKANGDTINFSKATAVYYSGTVSADGQSKQAGWRSGTFTVIATQTNRNTSTGQDETNEVGRASTTLKSIVLNGTPTQGQTQKKYMNASLKVLYDNGDSESDGTDTGLMPQTVGIDASPVYNYGWGEARKAVTWPTAQTANAYMDVKVPSATVDGTPETKRFTVRSTQNEAYITVEEPGDTWRDYAMVTHNQYKTGRESVKVTASQNGEIQYTAPTGTPSVQNCGSYSIPIKATGDNEETDETTITLTPDQAWSNGYTAGASSGSSSGYVDGQNDTLVVRDGDWVNGKLIFKTNAPNPVAGSSKSVQILSGSQIGAWNSGRTAIEFPVLEHLGTDNEVRTGAVISAAVNNKSLTVSAQHSANGVYNLSGTGSVRVGGVTIDLSGSGTLTATEAINYGKSRVNLNHTFDWNSSGTHANTYTIRTSGRTNENGVTDEDVDYLTPTDAINLGKSQVGLNRTIEWNENGIHAGTYTIRTSGRTTIYGVTNEDVEYLTPTDAIDAVTVDATPVVTDSASSGSVTPLISGKTYDLQITKNGTVTSHKYYSVPESTSVTPKVSKGQWNDGQITFTAGTSGKDADSVDLSIDVTAVMSGSDRTNQATITVNDAGASTGETQKLFLIQGTWDTTTNKKIVQLRVAQTSGTVVAISEVDASTRYKAGQEAVKPTSATISTSTADSSTGRRTATLTVKYKGPDTEEDSEPLTGVNVTSIYNAGKAAGTTQTEYPVTFAVTFDDGHKGNVSVNCANIWNQGAKDAEPAVPKIYTYDDTNAGDLITIYKYAFTILGRDVFTEDKSKKFYPNTPVTVDTSYTNNPDYSKIAYNGTTYYVKAVNLKQSTSTTPSESKYPGKTGLWIDSDVTITSVALTRLVHTGFANPISVYVDPVYEAAGGRTSNYITQSEYGSMQTDANAEDYLDLLEGTTYYGSHSDEIYGSELYHKAVFTITYSDDTEVTKVITFSSYATTAPVTEPGYYIYDTYGYTIPIARMLNSADNAYSGFMYPCTKVDVISQDSSKYQISYGGVTGWVNKAYVRYEEYSSSPSQYPGKTGWATMSDAGYAYALNTGSATVPLYLYPDDTSTIVTNIPAGTVVFAQQDPDTLAPSETSVDAAYKRAEHEIYVGYVQTSDVKKDTGFTITINNIYHCSDDYNDQIPTTMMLKDGAERVIRSQNYSYNSYEDITVSTGVNIADFFTPTKTNCYGFYQLTAVTKTELYQKVDFTVTYLDGSPSKTYVCEFKSYKKTSASGFVPGQTVFVYSSSGDPVTVSYQPTSPSGSYGKLVPHTPVTIVSGPENGYYQITYSQTGYNTVTGYINSGSLKSSVQGGSNYNYTGWLKADKTVKTVTIDTSMLCHKSTGDTGYSGNISLYIYPKGKSKTVYTSLGGPGYNAMYSSLSNNISTGLSKYFNTVYNNEFAYHSRNTCSHEITHRTRATVTYEDGTSETLKFEFTSVPK